MAGEDQVQGTREDHGRSGHREPDRIRQAEVIRYGRGGKGKKVGGGGPMSPGFLWSSKNRAGSMAPDKNPFTLAPWSNTAIPWAFWEGSPCNNGLIPGKVG